MKPTLKTAAQEGLADALGFVLGALAGWRLGQSLGLDFITSPSFGLPEFLSLALILAASGLGRWLFRRALGLWQARA